MRRRIPTGRARAAERGTALIIVLLLLLLVTLLGLAGIRGALLEERMAANANARSVAFQMAEALLREGETFAGTKPPAPGSGCTEGVCAPAKGTVPAWQSATFWDTNSGWKVANFSEKGFSGRYVVEKYGENEPPCATSSIDMSSDPCPASVDIYRVSVHARDTVTGTQVTLQSLYQVP